MPSSSNRLAAGSSSLRTVVFYPFAFLCARLGACVNVHVCMIYSCMFFVSVCMSMAFWPLSKSNLLLSSCLTLKNLIFFESLNHVTSSFVLIQLIFLKILAAASSCIDPAFRLCVCVCRLSVCLSVCQCVRLSLCLSICLSVCLSVRYVFCVTIFQKVIFNLQWDISSKS